ncbi:MAG: hypothetical protein IKE38_06050, partial [Erysipelotrichaceae bacterium]|nr:hypothetical protein [Erysipelotrichaceae bacterium]
MNRLFRRLLILFIAVFVLLAHVPTCYRNTVMAEEDDSAIVEPAEEAEADTDETVNEDETVIVQEEHEEETVTEVPAETAEEETVNEEYEETVSENEETEEISEEVIETGDDENVEEADPVPETEAEIEYGSHEFIEDDVNGLYIRVTDSEGAFPIETIMKTEPVAVEEVFDVISGLVENTISEITAV